MSPYQPSKLMTLNYGKDVGGFDSLMERQFAQKRDSIPPPSSKNIIMDFIKNNVTIDDVTGCWNWNKSVTSAGYGQFTRNGEYWTTHKFVATQKFGTIPDKVVVRHICHNTRCCFCSYCYVF